MIQAEKRDTLLRRARADRLIMGIVNVTPDSFSDGGQFDALPKALAHAHALVEQGADILDIGGESTRPGAEKVSAADEIARVVPVIEALADGDTPISIDTYKAETARAAVKAGAVIINDVTGLTGDPDMAQAVADTQAGIIVTYHRGERRDGIDLVADMIGFFEKAFEKLDFVNVPRSRIWLDPGVGFAKTIQQNFDVIHHIDKLNAFDSPVLVGFSRKSFIGLTLDRAVDERLPGTLASHLYALTRGAHIIRAHDVREHRDALTIFERLEQAGHDA